MNNSKKFSPEIRKRAVRLVQKHRGEYPALQVNGTGKVRKKLDREHMDVARCTVGRLMPRLGVRGFVRGKVVRITISDKNAPCSLDKVTRQFRADRPNPLWV